MIPYSGKSVHVYNAWEATFLTVSRLSSDLLSALAIASRAVNNVGPPCPRATILDGFNRDVAVPGISAAAQSTHTDGTTANGADVTSIVDPPKNQRVPTNRSR